MDLDYLITYCLSKPGVEETFPFNDTTIVFKVMGKMYALCGIDNIPLRVNLKCDPEKAIELRDEHEEITPGYHMSKKHWNTVVIGEGMLNVSLIKELIDDSYDLVVSSLTRKKKDELNNL
ncbi:MAG: MmcQ/YjbR family DNA-binding protein [Saprospiraceae bacterium]